MPINIESFKAYDIRGQIPNQLNADICYRIGNATAAFLGGKRIVIGRDMRLSSAEFADAVAKGLIDAGVEVRFRGDWGALNANYLSDALNRHQGQSAEISYRYTIDRGALSFTPFVSWAWNSDKLTNYYFGVSEAELWRQEFGALPDHASFQWVNILVLVVLLLREPAETSAAVPAQGEEPAAASTP